MPNPLMQFFEYKHLPPHLQVASKPFYELAARLDEHLPANQQKDRALEHLIEAKDCAVRAFVWK